MIVRLVAEGNLLRTLPPKRFPVSMLVRGSGVPHGSIVWAALHSFPQLNQTAHNTPPIRSRLISPSSRLLQEMYGRCSLGSLILGREKCRSLFFPACFSSARIWARSRASASSWTWVGSCPTCRPNARSRASCGPTLASRCSSRSLLALSSRYRAVSAASRSSQPCPVGVSGGVAGTDGVIGWFSRFSSSVDAHEREKEKRRTETAAREYSRIYNRLKARKRRGQITVDAWNQQVAQAQALKDAFKARQITREEYVQKLDAL